MTLNDETHTLYRYKRGRTLLYIGITNDRRRRMGEHRTTKPWVDEATTVTMKHYPSREAVLAAEKEAIKRERPLYNVLHNTRVEIDIEMSPEDAVRAFATLGLLICTAILAARTAADFGSVWWQKRQAATQGVTVDLVTPRSRFSSEEHPSVALTLLGVFYKMIENPAGSPIVAGSWARFSGGFQFTGVDPQALQRGANVIQGGLVADENPGLGDLVKGAPVELD